jgi:hypothetical protein
MPMAKKNRYYSENDQVGVTRAQLKRLRKARQVEYLTFESHGLGRNRTIPDNRIAYHAGECGGAMRLCQAYGRPHLQSSNSVPSIVVGEQVACWRRKGAVDSTRNAVPG